ncbi:glycylpeptide N-tetradecanoyltransferase NMT1 [Sporobolomyces salmoneus]|uniref:glycylpeptide N-tetradecanoyltransferase NMT1 n=1 Tax=Sporobolomyces salmoneus TaxID=183962 RepID=UPI0031775E36
MEESKLTASTTASQLELALLSTLASTSISSTSSSSDAVPATSSSEDTRPQGEEGDQEDGYKDGDLPEFSDPEDDEGSTKDESLASGGSKLGGGLGGGGKGLPPRMIPGKGMKGPAGRKKIPLSSLKARLTGGGSSSNKDKDKKPSPSTSEAAPTTTESPTSSTKGKGKSKGLDKLSSSQLDQIISKFTSLNPSLASSLSRSEILSALSLLQLDESVLRGETGLMGKGTKDTGGSHKFWKTQPVVQPEQLAKEGEGEGEKELKEGPLEKDKKKEEVSKEETELHRDFKWVTVDLNEGNQLKEVYELLTHHYVEDADASFRFDYSPEFIEWALKPPGYVPDWHVGIRVRETGKLVGFIAGVPIDLRIRAVTKRCTEINFLVVHKKLRSKRLAPLLITEVTRRTHLHGIFQAIYTSGTVLPTPFTRCQYYHRNLNPPKLVKLGFSAIPRNSTIARMSTYFRVPAEPQMEGLRELEKRDLKQVGRLLRNWMARFECAPVLSNREIEHALWSGRGRDVDGKRVGQVVWTYVIEDPSSHRITDFFSLYSLPSTAVKSSPLQSINAAYLFYYASSRTPSTRELGDGSTATKVVNWKDESEEERMELKERLKGVMGDALVVAQKNGFDVLNALTLQDNSLFLEDLKFGRGDGFLNFYLYNYHTKPIEGGIDPASKGSGIGVVML